ncbi:unnamed protein product [Periconia digitata]|uniref:Uncharacterized protein n=1 Tax=Periconia digitata TaxID=1303443 RepID=A0A9W4XK72_9PLEO|nr:unnamed protein product [Periconia digitata]
MQYPDVAIPCPLPALFVPKSVSLRVHLFTRRNPCTESFFNRSRSRSKQICLRIVKIVCASAWYIPSVLGAMIIHTFFAYHFKHVAWSRRPGLT